MADDTPITEAPLDPIPDSAEEFFDLAIKRANELGALLRDSKVPDSALTVYAMIVMAAMNAHNSGIGHLNAWTAFLIMYEMAEKADQEKAQRFAAAMERGFKETLKNIMAGKKDTIQ